MNAILVPNTTRSKLSYPDVVTKKNRGSRSGDKDA